MNVAARLMVVTAATFGLMYSSVTGASAARPEKEYFTDSLSGTDTSLCGFPIDASLQFVGFEIDFFDQSGDLKRVAFHVEEQDTYTANGTTLVSEPYTFNGQLRFSDDELVSFEAHGILVKVRLPDGSIFMGAGSTDILARSSDEFIVAPDHGVAKNQDAFCAALS